MIEKGDQELAVVEQRIFQASASIDPVESLRSTVQRLAAEGYSKEEIYQRFECVMLTVRRQYNGEDSDQEDALLEVMDMLTGFCKPDLILLPDET